MISCLYICSTYYHVYVALCKTLVEKIEADIVICDDIPNGRKLAASLLESGCFFNVFYFDKTRVKEYLGQNRLDWVFFQHQRSRNAIEKEFKLELRRYKDIYIFHDDILLGHYLADIHKPYHLLEDSQDFYKDMGGGLFARCLPKPGLKYRLRKLLNSGYFSLGQSRYTIDIEVNDRQGLAITHPHIREFPKKELYKRLSPKDKEIIFEIFVKKNMASSIPSHSCLLLTQPLFEDGFVHSPEEQDAVYRRVVQEYLPPNLALVIKPHPRENTDYSRLFPKAFIIDQNIPVEVLNIAPNLCFSRAVTLFSSALAGVECAEEKLQLGKNYIEEKLIDNRSV